MPDCSRKFSSKGFSSNVVARMALLLLKAFKCLGSKTEQRVTTRSNAFAWEVQLLWYFSIGIWGSVWTLMDMISGKWCYLFNGIIANVNPPMVRCKMNPSSNRRRFVTVTSTVRRMQVHPIPEDRSCKGSKSGCNCQMFRSNTKHDQNSGFNSVDTTSNIRHIVMDSFECDGQVGA